MFAKADNISSPTRETNSTEYQIQQDLFQFTWVSTIHLQRDEAWQVGVGS